MRANGLTNHILSKQPDSKHSTSRCEDTPQRVSRLTDHFDAHIVQAAAGPYHSVALAADGRVFFWGVPPNGIRSRDAREDDATVQELRGIDEIRPVQVGVFSLMVLVCLLVRGFSLGLPLMYFV